MDIGWFIYTENTYHKIYCIYNGSFPKMVQSGPDSIFRAAVRHRLIDLHLSQNLLYL